MSGSSEGRLVRVKLRFERDFTQLPNAWLRDELLSWKARGILAYLMSHDAGFTVSIKTLVTAGLDGRDGVRAGVDELVERGYLTREQTRTRHGALAHVQWTLLDPGEISYPQGDSDKPWSEPLTAKPLTAKPLTAKPLTAKPTTIEEQLKEHLSKELKSPTIDAHADREVPLPLVETAAERYTRLIAERCPASRRGRSHSWLDSGYCDHCGTRQPEAAQLVSA